MMARPHEERTSRLEGAYEQVADRLNSLDANMAELRRELRDGLAAAGEGLTALRSEMSVGFGSAGEGLTALRSEMSASYRSLIVAMTGQTALIIGAVIGVAFAMHR
ncbi:MAG: hypothetical protein ACP5O6_10555 [Candidatus Baltobacteraceae bacterium]